MRYTYPNELYHYGIHGMKWGVRRYQNPDGTLTPAGKKRYKAESPSVRAVGGGRDRRSSRYFDQTVKDGKDRPNISPAEKAIKDAGKIVGSARDTAEAAKRLTRKKTESPAKHMTEKELRDAINRMELERRYDSLSDGDISSGYDKVVDILSVVGGVVGIAGGAASIYAILRKT